MTRNSRKKIWPLGFVSPMVEPGTIVPIDAYPQLLFRGERLFVRAAIAQHFSIEDLRVGNSCQSPCASSVDAMAFSGEPPTAEMERINALIEEAATKENAERDFDKEDELRGAAAQLGAPWECEVNQIGQYLRLVVCNTSRDPRVFRAVLFGTVLY